MARQVMRRRASDNVYLHRDFHGALSAAIQYLEDRFGEEAVRQYLRAFAGAYYAPLKEALRSRGLVALEEHFRKVYEAEALLSRRDAHAGAGLPGRPPLP